MRRDVSNGLWARMARARRCGLLLLASGCASSQARDLSKDLENHLRHEFSDDMNPQAPPVEACADVPLLTPAQLDAGANAGELVAIDGTPSMSGQRGCTLLACTDESDEKVACCNHCTSEVLLRFDSTPRPDVRLEGMGIGCSGYDCAMHCLPFGNHPRRPYRFVGRYRKSGGMGGGFTLTVERYCNAPAPLPTPARDGTPNRSEGELR